MIKKLKFTFVLIVLSVLEMHAQNALRMTIPSDSKMIQVSRNILSYFDTIYQQKQLGAMREHGQAEKLKEITGEYPAFVEEDLCGWKSPRWNQEYKNVVQQEIDAVKDIWLNKKAIPSMCWHWPNPLHEGGRFPDSKVKLTSEQFDNIVTPGTNEYNLMMDDLKKHADYLQQLSDLGIPLVWRPLHEIDGGWFWWTDTEKPENTANLWKIVYNYLVHEREFHNLIWLYCAGVANPTKKSTEDRKKYYPGDEWCDMVSIDLYNIDYQNTGILEFWNATQTYSQAFSIMEEIAPAKMKILAECEAMPNVEKTYSGDPNFARWLWAMPWYCDTGKNPADWILKTYTHANVIMQPDLPDFSAQISSVTKRIPDNDKPVFSVFPNPFSDSVTITIPENTLAMAQIFDVNGKLLFQKEINIPASTIKPRLKPGTYIFKIILNGKSHEQILVSQ